ncbi:hypothetical protein [Pyxidicoccus xibeiensis]|uniref:hypothetical protein n=1 Tax=Pyxidicoccus xibeiensis TaxID=2906759 RepID=UPI0020A73080|nr:hypothetical protein [Pyxidicoccus xibeiensis]MCP3143117.1 hypothetical protein [Pyxidicoccus xibeiensis]
MKVWLKAMGLASSLGSLVPACAAFRAGLLRPSPAPDFETFFPGDETPGTVSLRPLGAATFGFSGVGRLVAILAQALQDLAWREDLTALGRETGLYVALPDPEARGFTTGKDRSDEDPDEPTERLSLLADRVVPPALAAAGLRWWGGPLWFHPGDNTAFAQALAAADEDLRSGKIRAALVLAVDSFCSPSTLELLLREGRLKTQERPSGLIPGEAGVALLLAPSSPGMPPSREPPVFLHGVSLGEDPASTEETDAVPSQGRVLAECALSALGPLGPDAPVPALVSDHDGQSHRAHEWGMLQLHLAASNQRLARCPAWLPALSFGSTGAASAGVAVATALRALQRGYVPSTSILVLSSADMGARAAIHLSTR